MELAALEQLAKSYGIAAPEGREGLRRRAVGLALQGLGAASLHDIAVRADELASGANGAAVSYAPADVEAELDALVRERRANAVEAGLERVYAWKGQRPRKAWRLKSGKQLAQQQKAWGTASPAVQAGSASPSSRTSSQLPAASLTAPASKAFCVAAPLPQAVYRVDRDARVLGWIAKKKEQWLTAGAQAAAAPAAAPGAVQEALPPLPRARAEAAAPALPAAAPQYALRAYLPAAVQGLESACRGAGLDPALFLQAGAEGSAARLAVALVAYETRGKRTADSIVDEAGERIAPLAAKELAPALQAAIAEYVGRGLLRTDGTNYWSAAEVWEPYQLAEARAAAELPWLEGARVLLRNPKKQECADRLLGEGQKRRVPDAVYAAAFSDRAHQPQDATTLARYGVVAVLEDGGEMEECDIARDFREVLAAAGVTDRLALQRLPNALAAYEEAGILQRIAPGRYAVSFDSVA